MAAIATALVGFGHSLGPLLEHTLNAAVNASPLITPTDVTQTAQAASQAAVDGVSHISQADLHNLAIHTASAIEANAYNAKTRQDAWFRAFRGSRSTANTTCKIRKYRKKHRLDADGNTTVRSRSRITNVPDQGYLEMVDGQVEALSLQDQAVSKSGAKYRRGVSTIWRATPMITELLQRLLIDLEAILNRSRGDYIAAKHRRWDGTIKTDSLIMEPCVHDACECTDYDLNESSNCRCGHGLEDHPGLPNSHPMAGLPAMILGIAFMIYPTLERVDSTYAKTVYKTTFADIEPCTAECGCTDFRLSKHWKSNCGCGHDRETHRKTGMEEDKLLPLCLEILMEDVYRNQEFVDVDGELKTTLYEIRRQRTISENTCPDYRRSDLGTWCLCGLPYDMHGESAGSVMFLRSHRGLS